MPADDDAPALSATTAAALASFLAARDAGQDDDEGGAGAACPFKEDWGLSQFWYTGATAARLAAALAAAVANPAAKALPRVACVACPSLFRALRERHAATVDAHLFEHDDRFAALGPYTRYDFNEPLAVPQEMLGAYEAVAADPPYLAATCFAKTAETVRALQSSPSAPILIMTGAVMQGNVWRELGARPAAFRPAHAHKLGNEFLASTNCAPLAAGLGGWDEELGAELDAEGGEGGGGGK